MEMTGDENYFDEAAVMMNEKLLIINSISQYYYFNEWRNFLNDRVETAIPIPISIKTALQITHTN